MRKLQALLKAILLRRTKKSQIDGKSILNLPERTTEQSHANFSNDELEFYQALETHTQLTFNKYLKANTVGRNYSNILVLLLRLRQAVSTLFELSSLFYVLGRVLNNFRVAISVVLISSWLSAVILTSSRISGRRQALQKLLRRRC